MDRWTILPLRDRERYIERQRSTVFPLRGAKLHKVQVEESFPSPLFFSHLSGVTLGVFARKDLFATSARIVAPLPRRRNLSIDALTALACLHPRYILAPVSTVSLFVVWLLFLFPLLCHVCALFLVFDYSLFNTVSHMYGHSLLHYCTLVVLSIEFFCNSHFFFLSLVRSIFLHSVFFFFIIVSLWNFILWYLLCERISFFLSYFMIFVKCLLFLFSFLLFVYLFFFFLVRTFRSCFNQPRSIPPDFLLCTLFFRLEGAFTVPSVEPKGNRTSLIPWYYSVSDCRLAGKTA